MGIIQCRPKQRKRQSHAIWVLLCWVGLVGLDDVSIASAQSQNSIEGITGLLFDPSNESYDTNVTSPVTLFSLPLAPSGLSLTYDSVTGTYQLAGSGTISLGGEDIQVSLGSGPGEGLRVTRTDSGLSLESIQISLTAAFALKGANFNPKSLTLWWLLGDGKFGIAGEADVTVGGNVFELRSGDEQDPGIVIEGGDVTKIELELAPPTAEIDLAALTISVSELGMRWEHPESWAMWGTGTVTPLLDEWDVSLGDRSSPGVAIESGEVVSVNMSVSTESVSLDLGGLVMDPNFLSIKWDRQAETTFLSGSGTILIGTSNELEVGLGNGDDLEGITLESGALTGVVLIVSGELAVSGSVIELEDVTFEKYFDPDRFIVSGEATMNLEADTMTLHLGDAQNAGMVIVEGEVQELQVGVSGDIDFSGSALKLDGLTMAWNRDDEEFLMWGGASLQMPGGTPTTITAGDSRDNPGIAFTSGVIQQFQVAVAKEITIGGSQLEAIDLGVGWDRQSGIFRIFGAAMLKLDQDFVLVDVGTFEGPGIQFSGGQLIWLEFAITSDVTINGLNIQTDALTYRWDPQRDMTAIFGAAGLALAGDEVSATFGSQDSPGFLFKDGVLQQVDVTINSGVSIGGIDTIVEDLHLIYRNQRYELSGLVGLQIHPEAPRVSVDLGKGDQPGLIVDTSGPVADLDVKSFTILIEYLKVGTAEMRKLALHFDDNGFYRADLMIALRSGSMISGVAEVVNATNDAGRSVKQLDRIMLEWEAPLRSAIKLAYGIRLYKISGEVDNLSGAVRLVEGFPGGSINSDSYAITGTFGLSYLGASLGGKDAAFIQMETTASLYDFGLMINTDLNLGAVKESGRFTGKIGRGNGRVAVVFGKQATFAGRLIIPNTPGITANLNARITGSTFDASGKFRLQVPNLTFLPRKIRGKTFSQASGRIKFVDGRLGRSFANATFKVSTRFSSWNYTIKWPFNAIGRPTVSTRMMPAIPTLQFSELDVTLNKGDPPGLDTHIYAFRLEESQASTVLVDIDWPGSFEMVYVSVLGPTGFYNVEPARFEEIDSTSVLPLEMDLGVIRDVESLTFIISPPSAIDTSVPVRPTMPAGEYQLHFSRPRDNSVQQDIIMTPLWQSPSVGLEAALSGHRTLSVDTDWWSHNPDSSIVDIVARRPQSDGTPDVDEYVATLDLGQSSTTVRVAAESRADSLWFLASIDDGVNDPQQSTPIGPIVIRPDLWGQFSPAPGEDLAELAGSLVFVDGNGNGEWDVSESSPDDTEPFATVQDDGSFLINGLSPEWAGRVLSLELRSNTGLVISSTTDSSFVWENEAEEMMLTFKRSGS